MTERDIDRENEERQAAASRSAERFAYLADPIARSVKSGVCSGTRCG